MLTRSSVFLFFNNINRLFQDVLRDQSHLEFFRRFLLKENSEIPLQFWNAVEQMRTSCRDAKSRQNKTILIVRKFFGKATDFGKCSPYHLNLHFVTFDEPPPP